MTLKIDAYTILLLISFPGMQRLDQASLIAEFQASRIKLVSYEFIHFGVIARLFQQIGVHSSRFVLFALFEDFSF